MAPTLQLNGAQASIYSRSNLKRAFPDFDESNIAGIYRRSDHVLIVRNDGSEQQYPTAPVISSFRDFTGRLKHFFSYLGPQFRGPSLWRNNAYVLFKGWAYSHTYGAKTANAQLQHHWGDRFIHLPTIDELKAVLQNDQFDLGHIVAPDGLIFPQPEVDLNSPFEQEQTVEHQAKPWCSCGSFCRQENNLAEYQAEIPGYQPTCIHLTWFNKYREFLAKRTEIRNSVVMPDKCVAWWYAPPKDATSNGRFTLLHTVSGPQAPLKLWRAYKPKEVFNEHHAWTLFDSMMEAGYLPYPGQHLNQLASAPRQLNPDHQDV